VRPIGVPGSGTVIELRQFRDYFEFYLSVVAEYASTLGGWMREYGIEETLTHNSGGYDMNALFVETVERMGKNFVLGTDTYYNLTWIRIGLKTIQRAGDQPRRTHGRHGRWSVKTSTAGEAIVLGKRWQHGRNGHVETFRNVLRRLVPSGG
jgi:hypothetical protein